MAIAPTKPGIVVDAAKVPEAIRRAGLTVTFRPGPTPAGFSSALYGVARNRRGVGTEFGILIAPDGHAPERYRTAFLRLVPGAVPGDATVRLSVVTITTEDPKTPAYSRRKREEYEVHSELDYAVAGLAPAASAKEGP